MKSYSQSGEDLVMWRIVEERIRPHYGSGFLPNILEIGSNDGSTYSNSLLFIEQGCVAVLVEPALISFSKLQQLHKVNPRVFCFQVAISDYDGEGEFYDSGTHIGNGDTSLLSTLHKSETERWGDTTKFSKTTVPVMTFNTFMVQSPYKVFDIISIDAEGCDFQILQQMKLRQTKTCIVCIEWNSKDFELYDNWFKEHWPGCELVYKNAENLIYYRQHRKMEGVV